MEKPLANAVRVVLALVLVAPLIVMADPLPSTIFPYVVGKAVYTRLLVELAFGLWLALVLWHPEYRLPRSRLLWVLAIYVAVVLVASFTGVSLQRSLWSTYERMQGWVGLLHYAAFSVMLASVFRTFRDWRLVLNVNLAVGFVMGLLGVSQMAGLDLLAYLVDAPRISITLGNATYVGAYMLVNALIAAAFLAHSLASPRARPAESPGRVERRSRRGRRQPVESQGPSWASPDNLMRAFWVSVILLDLLMLYQSGTRGAIVGLAAGLGTFVAGYILWGKLRPVRVASIALAVAGAVLVAGFLLVRNTAAFESVAESSFTLQRLASLGPEDRSVRSRWTSTLMGLEGFADRPVLGWGPENYSVAYDLHLTEQGRGRLIAPHVRPGAQQGHRGDGHDGRTGAGRLPGDVAGHGMGPREAHQGAGARRAAIRIDDRGGVVGILRPEPAAVRHTRHRRPASPPDRLRALPGDDARGSRVRPGPFTRQAQPRAPGTPGRSRTAREGRVCGRGGRCDAGAGLLCGHRAAGRVEGSGRGPGRESSGRGAAAEPPGVDRRRSLAGRIPTEVYPHRAQRRVGRPDRTGETGDVPGRHERGRGRAGGRTARVAPAPGAGPHLPARVSGRRCYDEAGEGAHRRCIGGRAPGGSKCWSCGRHSSSTRAKSRPH